MLSIIPSCKAFPRKLSRQQRNPSTSGNIVILGAFRRAAARSWNESDVARWCPALWRKVVAVNARIGQFAECTSVVDGRSGRSEARPLSLSHSITIRWSGWSARHLQREIRDCDGRLSQSVDHGSLWYFFSCIIMRKWVMYLGAHSFVSQIA